MLLLFALKDTRVGSLEIWVCLGILSSMLFPQSYFAETFVVKRSEEGWETWLIRNLGLPHHYLVLAGMCFSYLFCVLTVCC